MWFARALLFITFSVNALCVTSGKTATVAITVDIKSRFRPTCKIMAESNEKDKGSGRIQAQGTCTSKSRSGQESSRAVRCWSSPSRLASSSRHFWHSVRPSSGLEVQVLLVHVQNSIPMTREFKCVVQLIRDSISSIPPSGHV